MKNLLKVSLVIVSFVAMNTVLAQTPATTTPAAKPATQGSTKKNKKVAVTPAKAQTTPATKTTETKASETPSTTGTTDGKTEQTGSGTGTTNTRMAISEQGIPADKPKTTTTPVTTPK